MAAGARGARSREILIEVSVERVRDVASRKSVYTPVGAGEVETAIDDRPIRIAEVPGELDGLDQ
jgi:hypothetical protein